MTAPANSWYAHSRRRDFGTGKGRHANLVLNMLQMNRRAKERLCFVYDRKQNGAGLGQKSPYLKEYGFFKIDFYLKPRQNKQFCR